jgi:hypothetical protein
MHLADAAHDLAARDHLGGDGDVALRGATDGVRVLHELWEEGPMEYTPLRGQ